MQLFIRFMALSFPVVFGLALFWPISVTQQAMGPQKIEITPASSSSESVEKDVRKMTPTEGASADEDRDSAPSGIYRWENEDGTVTFSDQPGAEAAVPHTPQEIGHYEVSPEIKRRIERENFQMAQLKQQLAVRRPRRKATGSRQEEYAFSMASAGQKHGYVILGGRISGGSACEQLRVNAKARNNAGHIVGGHQDLRFNGIGSELFEMKIRSSWHGGGYNRPQWEIVKLAARCLSQGK